MERFTYLPPFQPATVPSICFAAFLAIILIQGSIETETVLLEHFEQRESDDPRRHGFCTGRRPWFPAEFDFQRAFEVLRTLDHGAEGADSGVVQVCGRVLGVQSAPGDEGDMKLKSDKLSSRYKKIQSAL
jgi:hypothetical protein